MQIVLFTLVLSTSLYSQSLFDCVKVNYEELEHPDDEIERIMKEKPDDDFVEEDDGPFRGFHTPDYKQIENDYNANAIRLGYKHCTELTNVQRRAIEWIEGYIQCNLDDEIECDSLSKYIKDTENRNRDDVKLLGLNQKDFIDSMNSIISGINSYGEDRFERKIKKRWEIYEDVIRKDHVDLIEANYKTKTVPIIQEKKLTDKKEVKPEKRIKKENKNIFQILWEYIILKPLMWLWSIVKWLINLF